MLSVTKTMVCELTILINLVVNNYLMTRDYARHQDQAKPGTVLIPEAEESVSYDENELIEDDNEFDVDKLDAEIEYR
jgi:hypothetical protein